MKVFGLGLNKTGTSTLAECLGILGYQVCPESVGYSLSGSLDIRTTEVIGQYSGFQDFPWYLPSIYEQVYREHPEWKFILTKRDPDNWWNSLSNWLRDNVHLPNHQLEMSLGALASHEARCAYQLHNARVQELFGDNLLVVDWEQENGWIELCDYLEADYPNVPMPHRLKYDAVTKSWQR